MAPRQRLQIRAFQTNFATKRHKRHKIIFSEFLCILCLFVATLYK